MSVEFEGKIIVFGFFFFPIHNPYLRWKREVIMELSAHLVLIQRLYIICDWRGAAPYYDHLHRPVFIVNCFSKPQLMSRVFDFNKALGKCYPFPCSPVGKQGKCGSCLHGYMALTWMCLTWLLRLGKLDLASSLFVARSDRQTDRQTSNCICYVVLHSSSLEKHRLVNTITERF